MIGQQLGNYVVLTELGRGGMGDVYVAQDTRLDRRVALKLPRRDIAASVDRLRLFQREARAAAALNHPNIVHLYAVEEVDDLVFITMELVTGRSLRQLLAGGTGGAGGAGGVAAASRTAASPCLSSSTLVAATKVPPVALATQVKAFTSSFLSLKPIT